jgi:hypothetical protein
MRGWLWLLCVVACSRRIEHFHDFDAATSVADASPGDGDQLDGAGPVVCPQAMAMPVVACPNAGFGLPTALVGDAHVMSRLADVNADGKLDLVSPELGRDRVAVAFGRGDGTFQAPAYYAVSSQPVAIDVSDLEGDGDIDIVVGSQASTDLSILRNDGTGAFATATPLTVSRARTISVASMDADNRPDLVIASALDQTVTVVLATPTGYATPTVYNVGFTVMAAATGDLDNDGDIDIVAVGSPNRKVTLTNYGGGAFMLSSVSLLSDGNDVAIADFDGDGLRDVAVAAANAVEIYTGSGTTMTVQNFQNPRGITAADVDKNGKPDFVVVGWAGLLVIRRGPVGQQVAGYPLELPAQGPEQVTAGDLDGDGHVDLVASSTSNRDNGVLVLRNSGTGVFTLPISIISSAGGTLDAAIGDLDGDGQNDLVRVFSTGFEIYWGANGALLADGVPYLAPNGAVAIGDVTVDGLADIVVANTTEVRIFRGTGQRHFASAGSYPIGGITSEVHFADLGGNCAPEIVLVHPNGPAGTTGPHTETFAVMRNHGDGTFDPELINPVQNITSVTVADFDEDGKLDAITSAAVPPQIGFFHGNGDGTFNNAVTHTVALPLDIASSDIDGDGHRDLMMSNIAVPGMGYVLGAMHGHGDGTFDGPAYQPSLSLQTSHVMQVLDFDGNGRPDVVFRNSVGVGVHLGQPNGTFDAVRVYPMGGTPLVIGDLNGDKRADSVGVRDALFGIVHGTCDP